MNLTRKSAILAMLPVLLVTIAWPRSVGAADLRKIAVRGDDQKWRIIDPADLTPLPPGTPTKQLKLQSTWTIIYLDQVNNTGVGFDDPTEGASRRATAEAAIAYLDGILNEPGSCEVEFQQSQTDGGGPLAVGGTTYWSYQHGSTVLGFAGGFAYEHLTTGIDPLDIRSDINITVDFGRPWNSDMGPPDSWEYDLYSVILHELTHGLGFDDLSDASGNSTITFDNPGAFSFYTDYLMRGAGNIDLWIAGGEFVGVPSDLTSNDLYFAGADATLAYGSPPPVHAPATLTSASLCHWGANAVGGPVMSPGLPPGIERRTYLNWEIAALRDMNYTKVLLPMFADGFESGDTTRWSDTTP